VHLLPAFGSMDVAELGRTDTEQFMLSKLRRGLSAKSVRNYLGLLHGVLDSSEKQGGLPPTPPNWLKSQR
jgi:hypothetical protein